MTTVSELRKDGGLWHCHTRIEKFHSDAHYARFLRDPLANAPYEILEIPDNVLLNAGITLLWGLISGGTTPAMSSGHCRLGVGSDTTAAAATQTQLNPSNTAASPGVYGTQYLATGVAVSLNTSTPKGLQVATTFDSAHGNFVWAEWGVEYVGGTPADGTSLAGTLVNRKQESLGTKSGGAWTMTVTLSLS